MEDPVARYDRVRIQADLLLQAALGTLNWGSRHAPVVEKSQPWK
jgi:hypothetical protein